MAGKILVDAIAKLRRRENDLKDMNIRRTKTCCSLADPVRRQLDIVTDAQ